MPEIIKLAQYALTLPLHTCSCERVFSNQNLIVTRLRSRLNPKISDRLLRVRTQGKGITNHDLQSSLNRWRAAKNKLLKRKTFITVKTLFIQIFVHLFIQVFFITSQTSVDTEMCCPKGKCGCQYFILQCINFKKAKQCHGHRGPGFFFI